jgi:Pyruvate phosphate dikinase, AMP/ATP-binding domain
MSVKPVEAYGELVDRFPGIEQVAPVAVTRLAFHMAAHAPGGDIADRWSPDREDWHTAVDEVTERVDIWRSKEAGARLSRFVMAHELGVEIAQQHAEARALTEMVASLETLPSREGLKLVSDYLDDKGFQVQQTFMPSPLFPEGRTTLEPVSSIIDLESNTVNSGYRLTIIDTEDEVPDEGITKYLTEGHRNRVTREKLDELAENLPAIDQEELAQLQSVYGAKAAHLLVFKRLASRLNPVFRSMSAIDIIIPDFLPVEADIYDRWLEDPNAVEEEFEALRKNTLAMKDAHNLVVVRSSAVKSEDGAEHTGAGIYASIAVSPKDKDAFHAAIRDVYASTRSERALAYQTRIGVSDDRMGLVVQAYIEDEGNSDQERYSKKTGTRPYGQVESSGVNPNLMELHTQKGSLLFDKNKLARHFLEDLSFRSIDKVLHTLPDHSTDLDNYASAAADIPHIALLAERVFGMPMQIEYVNNSVVQIRPLKVPEVTKQIEFPDHLELITESAATGYDDRTLEELDDHGNNSDKVGFVIFSTEWEFSIRGSENFLPKEGAVVILRHSNSGHVQALCREKGLMCFYPDGDDDDSLYAVSEMADLAAARPFEVPGLRFVSDGYRGKVYIEEEK